MTDNDIKKALGRLSCKTLNDCKLINAAIDYINRLEVENERLEKENSTFAKRFYKKGAKDFAKRLKQEMQEWNYDFVSKPLKRMALSEVDNLLKEMVGDSQ